MFLNLLLISSDVGGFGNLIFCILFTPPFIEFDTFVDILPAVADIEFTFILAGTADCGMDILGADGNVAEGIDIFGVETDDKSTFGA